MGGYANVRSHTFKATLDASEQSNIKQKTEKTQYYVVPDHINPRTLSTKEHQQLEYGLVHIK